MAKALLTAARSSCLEAVKLIFKQYLSSKSYDKEILNQIFQRAVSEGLSNVFEVTTFQSYYACTYMIIPVTLYPTHAIHYKALRDFRQELMLCVKLDGDGNTLGHKAASNNNPRLFKVRSDTISCQFKSIIL